MMKAYPQQQWEVLIQSLVLETQWKFLSKKGHSAYTLNSVFMKNGYLKISVLLFIVIIITIIRDIMAKFNNRKRAWKQGKFTPVHPKKYIGSHPIVYRSSLELSVMRFFDASSYVLEWGSESIIIPYIKPTDGKVHRYYTDFNVKIKDTNGNIRKYVIEVKPYKQTLPPKNHGNKKQKTLIMEQVMYAINRAKWDSAEEWCSKHGYIFSTITERDINKFIK